jgi:hypothetical protein
MLMKKELDVKNVTTLSAQVTTGDLVAIKVSEFENKLMVEEKKIVAELAATKKELKETKDGFEKMTSQSATNYWTPKVKKLLEAYKDLNVKVKCSMQASIVGPCEKAETLMLSVVVSVDKEHSYCNNLYDAQLERKLNDEEKKAIKRNEMLEKAIDDAQRKIIEIRTKLSKIGTMERAVRAEIARKTLGASGFANVALAIADIKVDVLEK